MNADVMKRLKFVHPKESMNADVIKRLKFVHPRFSDVRYAAGTAENTYFFRDGHKMLTFLCGQKKSICFYNGCLEAMN